MKQSRFGRLVPFLLVLIVVTVVPAQSQTYSVLYNFGTQTGGPWGMYRAGLIAQGLDGSLYTAAQSGGASSSNGAAYSLTLQGGLKVLHSFNGTDGTNPRAGLTLGTDGSFYGITANGGSCGGGTSYKVGSSGGFTTLYQFPCADGFASTPLTLAQDGTFYGATYSGGAYNYGQIYRIAPNGQYSVIIDSGDNINSPLLLGTDGAFYAESSSGGSQEYGGIFKITTAGQITYLHSFDSTNGYYPHGGLYQGTDGNFYGTTDNGGAFSAGVVFQLTPAGVYSVLHHMNGTSDGAVSYTGLIQATDGNFYGVTSQGGIITSACPSGCGTLFRITPQGAYSVLHTFTHVDGDSPQSSLYQHTNGRIYGATEFGGTGTDPACNANCGVFFSLDAGLAPYAALTPFEGTRGSRVVILGQGFKSATAVTFNGVAASFTIVSDTTISVTVPGTATTGIVKVTLGRLGSLSSKVRFTVH